LIFLDGNHGSSSHFSFSIPFALKKTLLLFSLMLFGFSLILEAKPPVKKIAFIGRYSDIEGQSGSNEWYDGFVSESLREFLKELNKKNNWVRLELEVFNINQDPQKSDSVYQMVADNEDYILVMDNSWGHDMAGARNTIVQNAIPTFSINAYKGYLDYGPQTLFLLDYESDIFYISAFAKKILERDSIDFISEDDVVFHEHFLHSFDQFDLKPSDVITYKGQQNINKLDSIRLFSSLYDHFVKGGRTDNRVVLYNSHFMWGNEIVAYLNNHLTNSKFMSWSVPQKEYIASLKNGNQIVLHHKSRYAVSEPVFLKHRELLKKDPRHFTWDGAASLMEDFSNVMDLLDNYLRQYEEPDQINKSTMADYLKLIRQQVTIGSNEVFVFNDQGKMIREKTFTVYGNGGYITYYPFQLNEDYQPIPSLNLGIDLQTIYDVDLNTNSFKADFEYWLTGDSIHHEADQFIRIKNLQKDESVVELLAKKFENGKFLKRFVVSGKFYTNYKSSTYPFDEQNLDIAIELLNPTDELRITVDPVTFEEKGRNLKINGWSSSDYYVTIRNNIFKDYLADFGNYAKNEIINIHFNIVRNFWGSILQIILPLFFIGTISIGILFVRRLTFSDLGEVIVGLFLSIVAFSISLAQFTPKFDDLTKADQLFLLTFVLVFSIFVYLIVLNSRHGERYTHTIGWVKWSLSILYPGLFALISLL
jgi:hypothetical protein